MLKPITLYFFLAQLLDIVTTIIGVRLGLGIVEINPLGLNADMYVKKTLVILMGMIILQRLPVPKLAWVVVVISFIAPIWNVAVITLEILSRV